MYTENHFVLAALALGFAPGVFWLWYFVRRDVLEPEPAHQVRRAFFIGMLAVLPAALIETAFPVSRLIMIALIAPVVEELCKFAALRTTLYRSVDFNEPMDGVVYAAAIALGFASVENVFYLLDSTQDGLGGFSQVTIIRAFFSVPGHALFSVMWGYALGVAKFEPSNRGQTIVPAGLGLAIGLHSVFNLSTVHGLLWTAVMLIFVPVVWEIVHVKMGQALRASPFRNEAASPTLRDEVETISQSRSPWYDNRVLVVTLLFLLCFPIGLYGLWKTERFSSPVKVVYSALWGYLVVLTLLSGAM
jgi:RsiW-degrading membrane proteinase PrsW (M82 family)